MPAAFPKIHTPRLIRQKVPLGTVCICGRHSSLFLLWLIASCLQLRISQSFVKCVHCWLEGNTNLAGQFEQTPSACVTNFNDSANNSGPTGGRWNDGTMFEGRCTGPCAMNIGWFVVVQLMFVGGELLEDEGENEETLKTTPPCELAICSLAPLLEGVCELAICKFARRCIFGLSEGLHLQPLIHLDHTPPLSSTSPM